MNELISVIIPTYARKDGSTFFLLKRAIRSVYLQRLKNYEILVIIDGISEHLKKEIEEFDSGIHVIFSESKTGAGTSRNIGVNLSKGEYIAFLDDDDEWLPQKMKYQLQKMEEFNKSVPIFSFTRFFGKNHKVFPRKNFNKNEDISNFLFVRNFFYGYGFIQTSTIIINRKLANKINFEKNLKKHQDWDFELKVNNLKNVEIVYLHEIYSIYHEDAPARERVGGKIDYKNSLNWGINNKEKFTTKAFNWFIINIVFPQIVSEEIVKKDKILAISKIFITLKGKGKYNLFNLYKIVKYLFRIYFS